MSLMYDDLESAITEGRVPRLRHDELMYRQGPTGSPSNFTKMVVLETIHDPGMLTDTYISYLRHTIGVSNMQYVKVLPRNTIVARRLLTDGTVSDEPLFLLPFMPSHLAMPCKPGEHVWVFFDSPGTKEVDIGWWMWRIVGFDHTDDVNHTHAPRDNDNDFAKSDSTTDLAAGTTEPKYDFLNGIGNTTDSGERYAVADTRYINGDFDAYENILTNSQGSLISTYEAVPRYKKRPSDLAFEGSNNQLIVLGTDRIGSANIEGETTDEDKGPDIDRNQNEVKGKGTGLIDIVVGRGQTELTSGKIVTNSLEREEVAKSASEKIATEGDPDYFNDRSRILIAGNTMIDINFGLDVYNSANLIGAGPAGAGVEPIQDRGIANTQKDSNNSGDGAVAIKSDKVRIIARSDIVFYVTSFTRNDKGAMVAVDDTSKWAALTIRSNGDIVIKPGSSGAILLGGEDADKGLMASNIACNLDRQSGIVSGPPIISTMGGSTGNRVAGQGSYASRILVKT